MRKLIIEVEADTLAEMKDFKVDKIEFMEVLELVEHPSRLVSICRARLLDKDAKFEDVFNDSNYETRVIKKDDDGTYTFLFKEKETGKKIKHMNGYISNPYELRDGRVKITYIGDEKDTAAFLRYFEEKEITYEIKQLTDAHFPPKSPLTALTEKQKRVLITAYRLGYYDNPRKIDSRELAKILNIANPTLIKHRRKAEKKILDELLQAV
jgi:predicted DNA binding protein